MKNESLAIKVHNVSKNFRLPREKSDSLKSVFINPFNKKTDIAETQHALKNVSFEIKEGEFFGIVGRNGSGKSTLLKIMAGIYQPTIGMVITKGKLVPFIELGVGFNPELTGRENVFLNGALLGFSTNEVNQMYDDIVDFAELGDFMDQKLKNYSSGMQVRLAFSVATRSKADILLIDEVLAVGDADFQRKCFNYFKQLKNSNTTVIFVTHDMEAIREYCDRAMLIENSQIMKIGATNEIASAYSRLFTVESNVSNITTDFKRWGTDTVTISNLTAKLDSKKLEVIISLRINVSSVQNPILGFRVVSQDGREITGTNTKIEGVKLGKLEKGSVYVFSFSTPNIFSEGTYSVDPAVLDQDGITVYDWWNGASQFVVHKGRRLPYVVDPGFKFEAKK